MCASSQIRIGCSHGLHGPGRCICPTGKFERSDTIPPRCEDLPAFSVTFSARIGGELLFNVLGDLQALEHHDVMLDLLEDARRVHDLLRELVGAAVEEGWETLHVQRAARRRVVAAVHTRHDHAPLALWHLQIHVQAFRNGLKRWLELFAVLRNGKTREGRKAEE